MNYTDVFPSPGGEVLRQMFVGYSNGSATFPSPGGVVLRHT